MWDGYSAKYHGFSASSSSEQQASYELPGEARDIETHPYIFVEGDKLSGVGAAVTCDIVL